jgi:hypothetical protein
MHALVVFESAFGNTQRIAQAVADGLSSHVRVDVAEVGVAPRDVREGIDLLVVGGPTQALSMSRPGTRRSAARQAQHGLVSQGDGLREWLAAVRGAPGIAAATFDTRFKKPRWITGSAARAAEKRLRELGCRISAPSESFFVDGATGPLLEGEEERARRWGEKLGSVAARAAARS